MELRSAAHGSLAKENEACGSCVQDQRNDSLINTQPSTVICSQTKRFPRKRHRRRGILQDITHVASNLEKSFATGSSTGYVRPNEENLNGQPDFFQEPLEQVFKHEGARLKGFMSNTLSEIAPGKSRGTQVKHAAISTKENNNPMNKPD
ncbi:hypothetical protein K1719_012357 [Acacia pycnantha]|nr:hypothetical protein K1719_012357 [Acacia pycnantha]